MRNSLSGRSPLSKHRWRFLILALCVPFFLFIRAAAQADEIQITFRLDEDTADETGLTVGDVFQLVLEVRHPQGTQVEIPVLPLEWGTFDVTAQDAPETGTLPDDALRTRQEITAAVFTPGDHTTPPFSIRVTDQGGGITDVPVPPLTMRVRSVLQEGDSELRDIRPQAGMDPPLPWGWLITLGLAILAALAIWQWLRRRARNLPLEAEAASEARPDHLEALAELDRIKALGLPEKGQFKTHFSLMDTCLRRYLEQLTGLPAVERTTAEIASELKRSNLPADASRRLLIILAASDRVKFARSQPTAENARAFMQAARRWVEQTAAAADLPSEETK